MRLIGISGEIGVGKDTAADYLVREHGFHKVTIGKHIRNELCVADWLLKSGKAIPSSVRELLTRYGKTGREKIVFAKPTDLVARESLQWFGQLKRLDDPNYWVSKVACEIRDCGRDNIVWCDVRMPEEYNTVHLMGGEVWRINRQLVKRRVADIKALQHITETALTGFKFDAVIPNNMKIETLEKRIKRLL